MDRPRHKNPTPLELEVLQVIWEQNRSTVVAMLRFGIAILLAITLLLANVAFGGVAGSEDIELKELIQANSKLRSVGFQIFVGDSEE
jgi:hypothetical protein